MEIHLLFHASIVFAIAGIVKGVVGFGFPLVSLVLLTLSLGLLDALPLILVPTILTNIWQALDGNYMLSIIKRMWIYMIVAMSCLLLTSSLLISINVHWLTALLGGVLVFFSASQFYQLQLTVKNSLELPLSILLGAINGLISSITGVFLIPSVLYMRALGFSKDKLIQAMGIFFTLSAITLTISLGQNDLLSKNDILLSCLGIIPAFLGIYLGRWVRNKISEEVFRRVFNIALAFLGLYMLASSLMWANV